MTDLTLRSRGRLCTPVPKPPLFNYVPGVFPHNEQAVMNIIEHAKELIAGGHDTGRPNALTLTYECPSCERTFDAAEAADRVRCKACRSREIRIAEGDDG